MFLSSSPGVNSAVSGQDDSESSVKVEKDSSAKVAVVIDLEKTLSEHQFGLARFDPQYWFFSLPVIGTIGLYRISSIDFDAS